MADKKPARRRTEVKPQPPIQKAPSEAYLKALLSQSQYGEKSINGG